MNDSTLAILVSSIAPTLAGLGAFIVSLRTDKKSDRLLKKADESEKKTEQIHVLVNSNLKAVQDALEVSNKRVEKLEVIIDKLALSRKEKEVQ